VKKFPKKGEFVLAVVKRVMPYGAFCELTEYNNLEAFLHLSEVASRWIKNIHEFIHEGQHIVAKVIRSDPQRAQVDISLKRISEEEKRAKLEQVRRRERAKKLLEHAKRLVKSRHNVEKIIEQLENYYGEDVLGLFEEVLDDEHVLDEAPIPDKIKPALIEVIKKSIKKSYVTIRAEIELKCRGGNGVEKIKTLFKGLEDKVIYIGAPHYRIEIQAEDYKEGNKKMEKLLNDMQRKAKRLDCEMEWEIVRLNK
jgi:translation initiation factor 2 subunit 1